MREKIKVLDESNDRMYFTMLPNYILNHSTAVDQALYMQMKKVAGEDGVCFLSERTLMLKLGVGKKALKKSIDYLLKREWIKVDGYVVANTKGGPQQVTAYTINDIWRLNVEHYQQGASESVPLDENELKVLSKVSKGALQSASIKNPIIKTNNTNTSEQGSQVSQILKEMETLDPKNKKYYNNTTQRNACIFLLEEYGYEKVIQMIQTLPKIKNIPYMPSITTPCELRDKWQKVIDSVARERSKQKKTEVLFT